MKIWQLSVLFKPLIIGSFMSVVYTINAFLWRVIPPGPVKDALFKIRG